LNVVDIQREVSAPCITDVDAILQPVVDLSVVVHPEERLVGLLYLNPRHVVSWQRAARQPDVLGSGRMYCVQRVWNHYRTL